MKTLEQINCEIFNLVKKEKQVEYAGLNLELNLANDILIRESISKLNTEYGLIFVANQKLSLTEKGEKHKSFESYLKSLKKSPLDWYRIIPIILTFIFGAASVYFLKANYDLKVNESNLIKMNDSLINNNELLKFEFETHKDSLAETKGQLNRMKSEPSENTVTTKKTNDLETE